MLAATLREAAQRFVDTPAYITEHGWALSYRDLDRISDELAVGLSRRGLRAGDVLGLVLAPGPEYLLAYLAAAKLGAITAGVNDRLTGAEQIAVLERVEPRLVVAETEVTGVVDTVIPDPASGPATVLAALRVSNTAPPPLPPDEDRPVAIVFTSGTTGIPKGAVYGNRQLAFITATDVGDRWGGGGRSFTGTSFAHLGFMTKLAGNLRRGGTTFMMRRWSAARALALIAEQRMTSIGGVPAQLALMLRDPEFDNYDLASVQFIIVGGGPITPGLADEARRRFDAALATRYSCTEAGIGLGTAFGDPDEDAVVSVGRPLPGVELALLDADDRPVGTGDVGAVCLRSPAMMREYWRDADATRDAFTANGFVRTGDLGWLDTPGRLHLVGRTKEMYVRGGYNVYPVEVEAILSTHPDVAAVAVAPRPNAVMGEIGVAVVVPVDAARPPTLERLRTHGQDRLAAYKLPEELRLVDALPLTAMDKVDRRALAREVAEPASAPGDPER